MCHVAAFLAGVALFLSAAVPAVAQEIKTTIDISYSYGRAEAEGEIDHSRELTDKYDIEYQSFLGHYDFGAKLSVEHGVTKGTGEAEKRKLSPSLDLELSSDTADFKFSYQGTRDRTDTYRDEPGTATWSNNYVLEGAWKPAYLPEVDVKWERKEDFEEQAVERADETFELKATYDYEDFGAEFNFKRSRAEDILPETSISRETSWGLNLDYGRQFSDLLDVQTTYEIQESVTEDTGRRGVFVSRDKDYTQTLDVSVKSDPTLVPGLDTSLTYDLGFEQDFEKDDFDYKLSHKLKLEASRDLTRWATADLTWEGSDDRTFAVPPDEDTEDVKSKLAGSITAKPFEWIDIDTKAERELITSYEENTGRDVEKEESRKVETTVDLSLLDNLDITATHAYEDQRVRDLLKDKSTKYDFKATAELWEVLKIEPSYNITLAEEWDTDRSVRVFTSKKRDWDAELKVSFDKQWLDLFELKLDYTLGHKKTQELDQVLALTETRDLTEDAKLNFKVLEVIRGMTLEMELSRKATDTLDDDEPMIVDRTLAVKLDWEFGDVDISASYQFDDKGDADDTLSFDTQVTWKREYFEITGGYQYEKVFAEETDVSRQYDLKLKFVF